MSDKECVYMGMSTQTCIVICLYTSHWYQILCACACTFNNMCAVCYNTQLVWEQSCELIIMLTEVVENGKV